MPKDDLRENEKRWRRKRLFRDQRPHPVHRFVTILFILAVLTILAWWLELLPLNISTENLLP